MKSMPKWFLIPPAAAALLILGTLSMQSGDPTRRTEAAADPAAAVAAETAPATTGPTTALGARREAPAAPRTPDLTRIVSALAGVLLLGAGGVLLLRKLRGTASATRGTSLLSLRQTLRLSARQAVHAIEFDDRILLIGESERGLALLESGKAPERGNDEAEIAARAAVAASLAADDEADEGATPKNLVIPRPAQAASLPRRLANAAAAAAAPRAPGLADFRNLLQKAGRP